MNISYLLIGGNQGDRLARLATARDLITNAGGQILLASALYETAAWGKTDQPDFLNQALKVATEEDAPAWLLTLLDIEGKMGRRRQEKYGPRIIDIDILFFNNSIIHEPQLTIPHPEIRNRRFALVPMEEIAPSLIHPVLHKTIRQLLAECTDPLAVKQFT
ncbi:MAG TPA: 2-amino-4-hydroxy-6-hydroxymethyldihydropteridine diphosphokinase [Puia sp.]|jgi:2-amino-4-hydroxy-6-hydroxymethyldihydropteridine diphosphokinase|nr:2-amino-4-hydroxy-6-hydroxymethyldihydropteridine diphosphokinase [Puia sp.]